MTRPVFCLVTDRRLFREPGMPEAAALDRLVEQVGIAAIAGVDLVHVRERDLGARELVELVRRCLASTRGSSTRVVVNDRVDVALAAGADGVHLRGDSLPTADVRSLVPAGFLVGRSVRNAREAAEQSAGTDYLVVGTVYPTPSKPGGETVVGPDELARAVRAVEVPVLGIGGMTEARLADAARTGAAGVAAIRLFHQGLHNPAEFTARVARWRTWFDRTESIS